MERMHARGMARSQAAQAETVAAESAAPGATE